MCFFATTKNNFSTGQCKQVYIPPWPQLQDMDKRDSEKKKKLRFGREELRELEKWPGDPYFVCFQN